MAKDAPFWKRLSLTELSNAQWESLCDGCGKCCLHKLQDEDTEELVFTSISCQYLDVEACRCKVYKERTNYVPECLDLRPENLEEIVPWLPHTCAYRLVYEGEELPSWHPLVCGDTQLIHVQHISVKDKAISECQVDEDDWQDYIID